MSIERSIVSKLRESVHCRESEQEKEILDQEEEKDLLEEEEVEDEVVETEESPAEEETLEESLPPEFASAIREMVVDLKNVAQSCDMFEEGFAPRQLAQVKDLCKRAVSILGSIR